MVAINRDGRGAESKRTKSFPTACSRRTVEKREVRRVPRNGVELPVAKGLEFHTSYTVTHLAFDQFPYP